jgi:hypothetical protein
VNGAAAAEIPGFASTAYRRSSRPIEKLKDEAVVGFSLKAGERAFAGGPTRARPPRDEPTVAICELRHAPVD